MSLPRARLAGLDWLVVSVAVIAFGIATGAFTGAVKGYDGWGHLTKVTLVLRDFPAIDWNFEWYSGSPFFLGGYPPLFYLSAGALTKLGVGGMVAMNLLVATSYIAMTLSIFFLVRTVTGSRLAGGAASGLLLATPGFWVPFVAAGLYTRVFGMGFASLAILFAIAYLRKRSALRYMACVAALWGALDSHIVLGLLAVVSVAVVLALVPDSSGRSRLSNAALVIPAILLAAYYYLPLAFYGQSSVQETAVYPTVSPTALIRPLIPVLPVTAVLLVLSARFLPLAGSPARRLMLALDLVAAALVAYAFLPLPRVAGLRAEDMIFFLSWFLAAMAGLVLGWVKLRIATWPRRAAPAVLLVAALGVLVFAGPAVASSTVRNPAQPQDELAGWHAVGSTGSLYRLASPSDNLSAWLNAVYDVPQTRGYGAIPQVLNPDMQYWLDQTVWNPDATEEQRTFLLDWYAARWLYVPAPYLPSTAGVVPRLAARPDLYAPVGPGNGGTSLTFEYLHASPVAAATNAPAVLVIADPSNYDLVFRDLSYSGFDSAHAITVRGGRYVDDYSPQELSQFDEVMLYGGGAHDSRRALSLLAGYVRSGGGLVVDTGLAGLAGTRDPMPVTSSRAVEVAGAWGFRVVSSPVTDGIDFNAFGPPRYAGGPWTAVAAGSLQSWATPVLSVGADPVVVVGRLGQGRVVWSGLNLPFHIDSYQGAVESRLLANAIGWAAGPGTNAPALSTAHRGGPEEMTVVVDSATRGVLFKESFFDRWHAYANGREVSIYPAGPGFMYVRVPPQAAFPFAVLWRYERSPIDWLGLGVSGATLVALVAWPWWLPRVRVSLDGLRRRWTDEG